MALITLTTDFGHKDYLAGAVKGGLLRINPDFRIHDITHDVAAFNYPQAAYLCRNACWRFPDHSFHLVLVNAFEQKPGQLLLARHRNQYVFCPDNGLINMITEGPPEEVFAFLLAPNEAKHILYLSQAIGQIINDIDKTNSTESFTLATSYIEKNPLQPLLGQDFIEGQIIFIDNFENVIVNITREAFEAQRKGRNFRIVFTGDEIIDRISESYADVAAGEKLAFFNAAGHLEIAVNKGNAAGLFGLRDFTDQSLQQHLFYQTVRAYFE